MFMSNHESRPGDRPADILCGLTNTIVLSTDRLGAIPIMTKSSACHLNGMTRSQLIAAKEEANEMGGYFICNGIERIIRCLILQVCGVAWWAPFSGAAFLQPFCSLSAYRCAGVAWWGYWVAGGGHEVGIVLRVRERLGVGRVLKQFNTAGVLSRVQIPSMYWLN